MYKTNADPGHLRRTLRNVYGAECSVSTVPEEHIKPGVTVGCFYITASSIPAAPKQETCETV